MAVITVTTSSDNPDDGLTLREAIAAAAGNADAADTITFTAAVADDPVAITEGQLEIAGGTLTIDGDLNNDGRADVELQGDFDSRLLEITGDGTADGTDVTLVGLRLFGGRTEGDGEGGGAIRVGGATLTLENSAVGFNITYGADAGGGGIHAVNSDVTLRGCALYINSTYGAGSSGGSIAAIGGSLSIEGGIVGDSRTNGTGALGGGIFALNAAVDLAGARVVENGTTGDDADGGGLAAVGGAVTVTASAIDGNSTSRGGSRGGGLHVEGGAALELEATSVTGNRTSGPNAGGGGVSAVDSDVTVEASTVALNVTGDGFPAPTASNGGGINAAGGTLTLVNATVSGNTTLAPDSVGGGVVADGTEVVIANSTIADNEAAQSDGGGLVVLGSPGATVANSIVAGNDSAGAAPDVAGNIAFTGGNIVSQAGVFGATYVAPEDVFTEVIGELGNNGGPTLTHNPVPGGPAVDAGDNGEVPAGVTTDQRGVPRIVGGTVDLGAVELFEADGPLVVTTLDDEQDGDISAGDLSLREALLLAQADPGDNAVTFAASLAGGTIELALGQLEITGGAVSIDGDIGGAVSADVTIDANRQSRILEISGDGTDVTLEGLALTGGLARSDALGDYGEGGAVRAGYGTGSLVIRNSRFVGNEAANDGGAVYSEGASLTVEGSRFEGNVAGGDGGALYHDADIPDGSDEVGSFVLRRSSIVGNTAGDNGGGVKAEARTILVAASAIVGNVASGYDSGGGGEAYGNGGGLYVEVDNYRAADGSVVIANSTIAGNRATDSGGGVYADRGRVAIVNSTITGNAAAEGGAVTTFDAFVSLANSVVAGNAGADGFSTVSDGLLDSDGGNVLGAADPDLPTRRNDVTGAAVGELFEDTAEVLDAFDDPTGVTGGVAAANGGPTPTVALLDSALNPAIGAADPVRAPATDQRGVARNDGDPDAGAFELVPNDEATTTRARPVTVDVLANGPPGATLLGLATGPARGAAFVTDDDAVFYLPTWPFIGRERLTYTVEDPGGATDELSVVVTVAPAPGRSSLNGGAGADTLRGSARDEVADGKGGADLLEGLGGDDALRGGVGNDRLLGGAGDDVLLPGGDLRNVATGGGGADLFLLNAPAGRVTVTDLDLGEGDRLGITIDALLDAGVLDGSRVALSRAGADLRLRADLDANGSFEAELAVLAGLGGSRPTLDALLLNEIA